jgi:hypothetical protein
MIKFLVTLIAVVIGTGAVASLNAAPRTIDLRDSGALEQLQQSNPAHFAKIQQILAGLRAQPARVEAGWLQTHFKARDVALSHLLLRTSYPPKQLLQFTLDNVRYTLHVTRRDLSTTRVPAQ